MAEQTASILQTDFPITLNGKEFILSFPVPSLFAFKRLTGISLFGPVDQEALTGKTTEEKVERTIDFCYVGLLAHHPGITRDEVANMIFPRDLPYVDETVGAALRATWAQPAKEEDAEGGERPLAPSEPVN